MIKIWCVEYYSLKYSRQYYGNRESHLVCLRKLEESEAKEKFLNRDSSMSGQEMHSVFSG